MLCTTIRMFKYQVRKSGIVRAQYTILTCVLVAPIDLKHKEGLASSFKEKDSHPNHTLGKRRTFDKRRSLGCVDSLASCFDTWFTCIHASQYTTESALRPLWGEQLKSFSQISVTFLSPLPLHNDPHTHQHPHHVSPELGKTIWSSACHLGFDGGGGGSLVALHNVYEVQSCLWCKVLIRDHSQYSAKISGGNRGPWHAPLPKKVALVLALKSFSIPWHKKHWRWHK